MTRRVSLPTSAQVDAAIAAETEHAGRPPAALAVAARLQMSNATFWRHFPQIAQELADNRRKAVRRAHQQSADAPSDSLAAANARLRTENAHLRDEMKVAAAEVQRLTLENHNLQTEHEHNARITPLQRRT
ncbi:hypothetical protein JF531_02940 [Microbacterium esteraromaticum]|uniref:hypothetical protein n=1 Tax=Microbacterium esteraromaticum TaxID=57043 RepID=UPI001A8C6398|nr:hypothetical protein [Microbacterium esteraromaticum]MBN8423469.1 hypothetical protein [Microbacterium esteraromaticum]